MDRINRRDHEALERAMAWPHRPEDHHQLDVKLTREPWHEVAMFAASLAQDATLQLKPHELPPCEIEPEHIDDYATSREDAFRKAALLLRRMLAAGVSRWEPDPIAALRKAAG